MKLMVTVKDLLPYMFGNSKDGVDVPGFIEGHFAGLDRKDRVTRSRFDEQPARRDQARDVIHLDVVQYSGYVVVYTMRPAENAITKRVEVAANDRHFDALVQRSREVRNSAPA